MRREYLVAAVPAAALLLAPLLPFLRTTDLWLGLPPLLVWLFVWCVLVTPTLLFLVVLGLGALVERTGGRTGIEQTQPEAGALGPGRRSEGGTQ